MRTQRLGKSGVYVPVIGLGTWSVFDNSLERRPLVEEALAAGVNLFDSSPMYGVAEDRLAAALGDRRTEALIATKVSATDADTGLRQIHHSLDLFGSVDLLQIHNIVGWQLHLPLLEKLRAEGSCSAIGASQGLQVSDDAFVEVMRTGLLDSVQVRYNPNRPEASKRILPLAQELGIGVIVMQPLRWGVLLAAPTTAELRELGVETWAQAVLQWILSDPRVTTVLTSSATLGRITTNSIVADRPTYESLQRHLVERIIARGPGQDAEVRDIAPSELVELLGRFLTSRKGASYCDYCLGRELRIPPSAALQARPLLGSAFVNENGPCLVCGVHAAVVRSKTIMR